MRSCVAELPVRYGDVLRAAAAIGGDVVRTPTLRSKTLSAITGADLWLKFENLQYTASFKDRGALNRLLQLTPEERARGVVAMSAGNHAQGVAYHATRLGIPAVIVMPRTTPNVKVASTEALGAIVVLHGDDLAAAEAEAEALVVRDGLVRVAPFDDAARHRRPGHGGAGAVRRRGRPRRRASCPSAAAASSPGWPWWRPRWRRPSS